MTKIRLYRSKTRLQDYSGSGFWVVGIFYPKKRRQYIHGLYIYMLPTTFCKTSQKSFDKKNPNGGEKEGTFAAVSKNRGR